MENYKELEKMASSETEESDDDTASEAKSSEDTNKDNKDRKVTSDYIVINGKPPSFPSENERERASEIGKPKKLINNIRPKKIFIPLRTKKPVIKKDTQIKLRNEKDEKESHSDESTSDKSNDSESEEISTEKPKIKKKVILVQVAKGKRNQHKDTSTTKPKDIASNEPKITKSKEANHESPSEEDKAIDNEVKKATYLRQAYEDACQQVVLRKCLRTLRAVLNDVCSKSRKCSSKYKDDFRNYGHEGCNEQFGNQKSSCRMGLELDDNTDSIPNEI
ncbi:uncharacterized protein LOC125236954 [Leguminivora glycinivorella]|uniref:uncharacterized protein LOC125236954 n=1 Tax=Leguminivora glycinivorella TaxID=1035111 RepID=UPI00200F6336|nr:uncharacterized protein LOC125236954 [Leguminivora glycinivorella]